MNIITNNIPRPLACFLDLPPKAAKDFDYIDDPHRLPCPPLAPCAKRCVGLLGKL